MPYLLQMDFPTEGPFGQRWRRRSRNWPRASTTNPDSAGKIWTQNPDTGEAGGVYLFDSHEAAQRYLHKHTARLNGFGITDVTAKIFEVNDALSAINHAPLPRA